jgi:hypothetical protein
MFTASSTLERDFKLIDAKHIDATRLALIEYSFIVIEMMPGQFCQTRIDNNQAHHISFNILHLNGMDQHPNASILSN